MKLERRRNALKSLEVQLASGLKPARDENGKTTAEKVPLLDSDIKRIKQDIENLKFKLEG